MAKIDLNPITGPTNMGADILGANRSGKGKYGKLGDGQSEENVSYIDDLFHKKFNIGMPGETFDKIKSDRAFSENFLKMLQNDELTRNKSTGELTVKKSVWENLDTAGVDDLYNQGFINQADYEKVAADKQLAADQKTFNTQLESILGDKYTAGTFDPSGESTQKWYDAFTKAEAPAEQDVINQTQESFNFLNPYATGSGNQLKATNDMIQKITADRMSRSISGASSEFANQESINRQDYLTGQGNKIRGLDLFTTRGFGNEDYERTQDAISEERAFQRSMAEQIAAMYAPREQAWYEPLATAAVSGLAGGLTGGLTSGVANLASGQKWGYNPLAAYLNKGTSNTAGSMLYNPYTGEKL